MPMSYLPAASPGTIVSKFELMMFAFNPMVARSALMRSASMPITVWPSGATNSLGAYWASLATFSVPFDLIAAGTVAAIAELTLVGATLDVLGVLEELEELEELELLPQPAIARTTSARTPKRAISFVIGASSWS